MKTMIDYDFQIQTEIDEVWFRVNGGEYSGVMFGVLTPSLQEDHLKISLSWIDPLEPGSSEFNHFTNSVMDDILSDFIELMVKNEQYELRANE